MKFSLLKTTSDKPQLFNYKKIIDSRGRLTKLIDINQSESEYVQVFSDVYVAESKKNTFRGLHYQIDQYSQRKYFLVLNGCVTFYCLNIKTSEIIEYELRRDSELALYIPMGWATGYHAKHDINQVFYASPDLYVPFAERVISCSAIKNLDKKELLLSAKDSI